MHKGRNRRTCDVPQGVPGKADFELEEVNDARLDARCMKEARKDLRKEMTRITLL